MLTSPHQTLRRLATALPEEIRDDVIIVGSLAAAVRFFSSDDEEPVRTKDIDCLLSPHLRAQTSGRKTAEALIANGWGMRPGAEWSEPGNAKTPTDKLPVVRLVPPDDDEWFLELLASPAKGQSDGRRYQRLETDVGHFALCSFRFLSLAELEPLSSDSGLKIARPEMMALANLLHHPALTSDTMSGLIAGRQIRRSSKDLGRVLALAFLAEQEDELATDAWPALWAEALRAVFPDESESWLPTIGSGVKQMLESAHAEDLEEAHHTCTTGLLARYRLDSSSFEALARRVWAEIIEPTRRLAH